VLVKSDKQAQGSPGGAYLKVLFLSVRAIAHVAPQIQATLATLLRVGRRGRRHSVCEIWIVWGNRGLQQPSRRPAQPWS
jgi:hypothetical protein